MQILADLFKIASLLLGGGSMVYFVLFLLFGTAVSMDLAMTPAGALLMDFCLSILFFCQHSIMVRSGFKNRLLSMVPEVLIPRFFSVISGLTLCFVIFFWQGTGTAFIQLPNWLFVVGGIFFILSFAGFYWGVSSLPFFDPLCLFDKKGQGNKKPILKPRGPYKIVRHPLYFFTLVLIWSSTQLTYDRLMFNLVWSGWIILGSWLEEKDLVYLFGDDYLAYQKSTPMLIPKLLHRSNR